MRVSRAAKLPKYTEREFMKQVAQLAKLHGWRVAHFRHGRTAKGWCTPCQFNAAGFPDLLLIRGHRLIVAELKVPPNKLMTDQQAWLLAFGGCGVESFLWRPDDWPAIEAELK